MICSGFPDPQLLFFVEGAPPLLYYSHIPVMIISLLLGFYVYFVGQKTVASRILLTISIVFSLWVLCNLITWTSNDSTIIFFVWAFFGILFALVSLLSVYFVYVFSDKKDISLFKKLIFGLILLPIIVLTPTRHNIEVFDLGVCGIPNGGTYFNAYYYVVGLLSFIWILGILVSRIRSKGVPREMKKQILLLGIGVEFFLFSFFLAGALASYFVDMGYVADFGLEFYGLFGMPIFMAFLTYIIVRYKAMNVKLLGAQVLVMAMTILIGSQFFFVKSSINKVLTAITFVLVIGFGYILIRSIQRELERREELQMMTERLSQANERLKKLDRAKSDFISIASHQLRTPLTAIKGFISLILEGSYGSVTGDVQNALNKVYLSNERLIHLVEDLLNISRIESGKLQFRMESCDLTALLRDVTDMFVLRAKEKGLKLTLDIPSGTLPLIMTDGQKVREVISNLIDNAIKYSETGEVKIQVISMNEGVRVLVKDTGMGIEQEDLPYLFQKFSRGKDIGRVHANGTGLGLYVGKNLMEALGGSIAVESDGPGKGATFSIVLPATLPDTILRRTEQQVFEQV